MRLDDAGPLRAECAEVRVLPEVAEGQARGRGNAEHGPRHVDRERERGAVEGDRSDRAVGEGLRPYLGRRGGEAGRTARLARSRSPATRLQPDVDRRLRLRLDGDAVRVRVDGAREEGRGARRVERPGLARHVAAGRAVLARVAVRASLRADLQRGAREGESGVKGVR